MLTGARHLEAKDGIELEEANNSSASKNTIALTRRKSLSKEIGQQLSAE